MGLRSCRTLSQVLVPAEVLDKGIPTAGLLAQVLVAKHSDHQPLYRQEASFGRAGLAIARSTLDAWIGVLADRVDYSHHPQARSGENSKTSRARVRLFDPRLRDLSSAIYRTSKDVIRPGARHLLRAPAMCI